MYTLLFLFLFPSIQDAAHLSQAGDYEASEVVLSKLPADNPTYYFYKLVNAYRLNDKREAERWAYMLEFGFEETPTRYRELALAMKYDMETWKDRDELEDISSAMRRVGDRLKNSKGGAQTQEMQKEITNRLAKMIKNLEDAQKNADQVVSTPVAPQRDSYGGNAQGTGQVDRKRVSEITRNWGRLPEKERASAIQEVCRNLSARDRLVIEEYFKALK